MNNAQRSYSTQRRLAIERRFRFYGLTSVIFVLSILGVLLTSIVLRGYTAFQENVVTLPIFLDSSVLMLEKKHSPTFPVESNSQIINYQSIVKNSVANLFQNIDRSERRLLFNLVSINGAAYQIRNIIMRDPTLIGTSITIDAPLSSDANQFLKGYIVSDTLETNPRIKNQQIQWLRQLQDRNLIKSRFNTTLFTSGDSRDPELSGILSATIGSVYLMLVTLIISFPIGVSSALYLEEFAPRNHFTDLIEVNINNLAAVPSVVFGLLGLTLFINLCHLPRSSSLVGGLVLSLIILPTIIIATRAALKAVPYSIREAALGIGASKVQCTTHHVLPLAIPGIMTGTIIGIAHALGEAAPLLMIGMVAFVVDIPTTLLDPTTVLPVQIYLWADSPERAFIERTAAAILILLVFLIIMNTVAIIIRNKFERKWQ